MSEEERKNVLKNMPLKTKVKYVKRKLIFNIIETYFIILMGFIVEDTFHVGFKFLLFILFVFLGVKMIIHLKFHKRAIHYAKMYKCMIASLSILGTLFVICGFEFYQSIIATIISAIIMTEIVNLKTEDIIKVVEDNLYHWKSSSKYQSLIDFVKYNYDDPRLLKYENYLKENDTLKYNLYDLKFKQRRSMEIINEITGIYDNKKIISYLDSIYETLKYNLCLEQ